MSIYDVLATRRTGAAEAELQQAEADAGAALPQQLRKFLTVTSGGGLQADLVLDLPDGSTTASFDLVPVGKLAALKSTLRLRSVWPWCRDGSGNVLVVDRGNKVHFWDHDTSDLLPVGCDLESFDRVVTLRPEVPSNPMEGADELLVMISDDRVDEALRHIPEVRDAELLSQALNMAAYWGSRELVSSLVKAGADMEWRRTPKALTALMAAASAGQLETVRLLVELGADRHALSDGRDARQAAIATDRSAIVEYLDSLER